MAPYSFKTYNDFNNKLISYNMILMTDPRLFKTQIINVVHPLTRTFPKEMFSNYLDLWISECNLGRNGANEERKCRFLTARKLDADEAP